MINIHIDKELDTKYKEHATYVFNTLFSILGLPYTYSNFLNYPINIYYGSSTRRLKDNSIYIYFNPEEKICKPELTFDGSSFIVEKDIIASAFYILSRREEVNSFKDEFNRFPSEKSILSKGLKKPIVNEYINLLFNAIKTCFENQEIPLIQKWYWPNGKEYAVCPTHDVDQIGRWPVLTLVFYLIKSIKSMNPHIFIDNFKNSDNISDIFEIEKEFGVGSSFFFRADTSRREIALLRIILSKIFNQDYRGRLEGYNLKSKNIRSLLKEITTNGFDIGLHGSFDSYNDEEKIRSEKKALENILGKEVKGIRQHYLRFEVPHTWEIQENAGFLYDTTLGYSDAIGFRAGICFPFYPFKMKILEIPLTLMDTAHMYPKDALKSTIEILEIVKRYNGLAVLLWHNNVEMGWVDAYKEILMHLSRENAWVASAMEIYKWYKFRDSLTFSYNPKKETIILDKNSIMSDRNLLNKIRFRVWSKKKYHFIGMQPNQYEYPLKNG